ncbi:MAG: hypothetical protein R3E11_00365 [Sphingobium sp.]|nr:hypothetical protein [Sphingobium sp.]MCP5400002.1 hypothetical protein [Sphingomonas sp.]
MSVTSMSATILSILMLAGLLLGGGGLYLIARRPDLRKQGWLMIVAAIVMFGNVAIWATPI